MELSILTMEIRQPDNRMREVASRTKPTLVSLRGRWAARLSPETNKVDSFHLPLVNYLGSKTKYTITVC